jgi:hypothetical protein
VVVPAARLGAALGEDVVGHRARRPLALVPALRPASSRQRRQVCVALPQVLGVGLEKLLSRHLRALRLCSARRVAALGGENLRCRGAHC